MSRRSPIRSAVRRTGAAFAEPAPDLRFRLALTRSNGCGLEHHTCGVTSMAQCHWLGYLPIRAMRATGTVGHCRPVNLQESSMVSANRSTSARTDASEALAHAVDEVSRVVVTV